MAFCERLSEQLALVATIDPQVGGSAAHTTDVVAMGLHRRAIFILSRGTGTNGITVAIQEANAGFTAGTANILAAAAVDVDVANTQFIWEVSGEAMADGNTALRGVFTSTGADILSVIVLADVERYHPGSDRNLGTTTIMGVAN